MATSRRRLRSENPHTPLFVGGQVNENIKTQLHRTVCHLCAARRSRSACLELFALAARLDSSIAVCSAWAYCRAVNSAGQKMGFEARDEYADICTLRVVIPGQAKHGLRWGYSLIGARQNASFNKTWIVHSHAKGRIWAESSRFLILLLSS